MKTLLSIILFVSLQSFAQKDTVILQGLITDSINNEPIPFVTISLDSTSVYTLTDLYGKFLLKIPRKILRKTHFLYISNLEYKPKKVYWKNNSNLVVKLQRNQPIFADPEIPFREPEIYSLVEKNNPKKDSCEINICSWFQPACRIDTCTNTIWHVDYNDKCITKALYKIYNPTKTKVIYKSNKIWSGKTGKPFPLEFHKADYYPYEITFYTNDKKTIVKKGKVYLHIW